MGSMSISDGHLSLDTTTPSDFNPDAKAIEACSNLTELADVFGSDKGSIKHNYTRFYEKYLGHLKNDFFTLGEIGVACGASLKMWSQYFRNAKIFGFDIRPECKNLAPDYKNIEIKICDATSTKFDETFDVLIDDGSHISKDIVNAFALNFQSVKSGGWYFIEDTLCTFNPNYPKIVGFERDIGDFARSHYLRLIDLILQDIDANPNTVIDRIVVHRQLIGIKKNESFG